MRREWGEHLERANKELEAFSYSVSHDLRAPLRAIDGFSRAVLQNHAGQLDEQGRAYLERVRAAAGRMDALIDELLSLSRVARAPLHREPVSITDLALAILEELREMLVKCYKSFYLRPSFMAKSLLRIRGFGELKRKMRAGLSVVTMTANQRLYDQDDMLRRTKELVPMASYDMCS